MPDPVTLGALVAAALSAGAIEAGKAVLGATAKDCYEQLKMLASHLLGPSVSDLEARPESSARLGVVAEMVEEQAPPDQARLKALAEALRTALAAEGRGATIDNRITVIASGAGAIAAGRDVNLATPPRPA